MEPAAIAPASGNRRAGSRAIARSTIARRSAGAAGAISTSGVGGRASTASISSLLSCERSQYGGAPAITL